MRTDKFIIDRMFGFPILVPVKQGIVQEFCDHEYHGVLSQKTAGKHISELVSICKNKLHKTYVKHFDIGKATKESDIRNIEYFLERNRYWLRQCLSDGQKTHAAQYKENIKEYEAKLEEATKIVNVAKQRIFEEHGIKL